MTTPDRPLSDKTDAELDTIISKRVPGDALSRQALDERHHRQATLWEASQATQRKLLSRTTIILWVTVLGVIITVIGVVIAILK